MKKAVIALLMVLCVSSSVYAQQGEFDGIWELRIDDGSLIGHGLVRQNGQQMVFVFLEDNQTWDAYLGDLVEENRAVLVLLLGSGAPILNIFFETATTANVFFGPCITGVPGFDCTDPEGTLDARKIF